MHKDIDRILFSVDDIFKAVSALGKKISEDYKGKKPLFVCVLKGSVIFFSDLIRAVTLSLEIDFLIAESYGSSHESSGSVEIIKDIGSDIRDRDVIIVEDIIDSGKTLFGLDELLKARKPKSLKYAVLIDKNTGRGGGVAPDYKCFDAENEFIVGYGLDYAEKYRGLPYIGVLKKEIYIK
jgi:hypoxanthine phosphoribosyltransferase